METLKKWQSVLKEQCMKALLTEEKEEGLLLLRAQRLSVWKDLFIAALEKELEEKEKEAFRKEAGKKVAAISTLLTGSPALPLLKSREYKEVIIPLAPEKIPSSLSDSFRKLFSGNEEFGFGGENPLLTLFDGKRSIREAAMILWALAPFTPGEEKDALPKLASSLADTAKTLLSSGAFALKELPIVRQDDIEKGLRELGIRAGDMVMTHSSLKGFGIVEGGAPTVIAALQSVITEEGLLALPALSLCVDGGTRESFDRATTSIETWVGTIPETFRKMPDVLRSSHPTHSVCAWGKRAEEFITSSEPMDVFAKDGPWGKLVKENGKILFLGEATTGNTFLHACEAWYGGYLDETIAIVRKEDGSVEKVPVKNYPGGCRGGWYGLGRNAPYYKKLEEQGIFRETKIGNARVTLVSAPELAKAVQKLLEEDPGIFLHKKGCQDCARIKGKIYWRKKDED